MELNALQVNTPPVKAPMKKGVSVTRDHMEMFHQSTADPRDLECMSKVAESVITTKDKVQANTISSNTSRGIHTITDHLKVVMHADMKDVAVTINQTAVVRECILVDTKDGLIRILTGVIGMKRTEVSAVAVTVRRITWEETVVMAGHTEMKVLGILSVIMIMMQVVA